MTTYAPVLCTGCARNFRNGNCQAFPTGIPSAIIGDGYDHREAYPGDQGLRFDLSPKPDAVTAYRQYLAFRPDPQRQAELKAQAQT